MDTSADAPYLDCAYKLVEYGGQPRRKQSEGKATLPGRKQVYRHYAENAMQGDVVCLEDDVQTGEPLLHQVMRGGKPVSPPEPLAESRQRTADELKRLPCHLRQLGEDPPYVVKTTQALDDLALRADREMT